MTHANQATGVLLVGHGTRSEVGSVQFLALADRIRVALDPLPVEPAFLELRQPDIDTAVHRLLANEIDCIVTVPLLLFAAAHAKEDIPTAVAAALAHGSRSNVSQMQASHLGYDPALVELSTLRMNETVGWAAPNKATKTCLLLVGRGSRDDSAIAEMLELARLRQQGLSGVKIEVAFLAMARPLLHEQLQAIASHGYRRVIIQPHLLFHGELVESVERQMAETRRKHPEIEWITTRPLADLPGNVTHATEILEKVILERYLEAGIRVVASGRDD